MSTAALLICLLVNTSAAFSSDQSGAQYGSDSNSSETAKKPAKPAKSESQSLPKFGIGIKVSSLGIGIEAASALSSRTNVRVGFNGFNFNPTFSKDGVNYGGQLTFRSAEAHFDWFPTGGNFHLSPGVLYNGNVLKATAGVPGGQSFTLGGTTYYSDYSNPINGNGRLNMNKVAPTFVLGWGNILPRSGRHFSVPFEIGAGYVGSPKVALSLYGSACDSTGLFCRNVSSDPTIQSNIQAEQTKINNSASPFKFYPIISTGIGYKF